MGCCELSIAAPQLTSGNDSISIDWRDSLGGMRKIKRVLSSSKYHYVWLRDNCRCPQCFNPGLNQRFIDSLSALGRANPTSLSLSASEDGETTTLRVVWDDGHKSDYSAEWLSQNAYDGSIDYGENKEIPSSLDTRQEPQGWGQEIAADPPRMAYDDLCESNAKFLEWSGLMEKYGFVFVDGTPLDIESVKRLVHRVGCAMASYYGDYYESSSDGR